MTRPFAKAHLLMILMVMGGTSILFGLDVVQPVIVLGACSLIAPLGYAALLRLGSFTFTGARAGGARYQPTPVKVASRG